MDVTEITVKYVTAYHIEDLEKKVQNELDLDFWQLHGIPFVFDGFVCQTLKLAVSVEVLGTEDDAAE